MNVFYKLPKWLTGPSLEKFRNRDDKE